MVKSIDFGILILRLSSAGLMFWGHGIPKIKSLLDPAPIQFVDVFGMGQLTSLILATCAEVLCTGLIILGFKVRWASALIVAMLVVGIFVAHSGDALFASYVYGHEKYPRLLTSSKELAVIYASAFFALVFIGSGRFSLDQMLSDKRV